MTTQIQMIDYQMEIKVKATVLANEIAHYKMVQNRNLVSDTTTVLQFEIERMQNLLAIFTSVLE